MKYRIPFNKPFVIGNELEYIAQSIRSGHIAGGGLFTKKCEALLREKFKARKVLMTVSGTAALEMSALLCGVGPGDEVIVPSFAFPSTVNAFYLRGSRPVFLDIRPDTLNMDETAIEGVITDRTKAIVALHYGGVGCAMDIIMELARRKGLFVVEDAAHGIGALHKERHLGTIGDMGIYSFHETKNVICGEGGAILVNDESLIGRAEIIRDKGTNRAQFFRGEVDKYTWMDVGSSYLPADMLAAFLLAQIENLDKINERRRNIFEFYSRALQPLSDEGLVRLPLSPHECEHNNHMFYIILKDGETRDRLLDHMKADGIYAAFHFVPLHLSPVGRSLGYRPGQFPVTESLSSSLLRLPFFYDITEEEQAEVVHSVNVFFKLFR